MKAFIYLRVSGKSQIDGDGFDRQLIACESFAQTHAIEISEVFREQGVSGTKDLDDRPALSELFAALEENGIKTVIVERLDRLARDLMVQETIISDMQRQGYTLLSTCEPDLCSSDPSRVLVRQIFGAIAQYDKAMITIKLRGARQRIKAHGRHPGAKKYSPDPKLNRTAEGRKPYGHYPGESAVLAEIMAYRRTFFTADSIAANLNGQGITTRNGKPWIGSTIRKIIKAQESAT